MKTLLLATVMALGLTGLAQAADPVNADRSGLYIGGNLGSSTDNKSRIDLGGAVGYQVGPYARVEADFDHAWRSNGVGNMAMANAIGQYRIPNSTLTPYVLAGVGVGIDKFGATHTGNSQALYNVGAGMRVAVSESVELDARYRMVHTVDSNKVATRDQNLFTLGAAYRF